MDRLLVKLMREVCEQKGIVVRTWSDDWILELSKNGQVHRAIGYRFDLNSSAASQIAQDKAATYTILAANDIPAVRHEVVRRQISEAQLAMMQDWGDVIIKPLTGSGGYSVRLFSDVGQLSHFVRSSAIPAWAVAPLVPIDNETRIILLDGEVMLAYAKQPIEVNGIKMFNLGLGGNAINTEPAPEEIAIAKQAQVAIGLRLCAVDIVSGENLPYQVLEVNDAFGMEHYARVSEQNKDRTRGIYDAIVDRMFS